MKSLFIGGIKSGKSMNAERKALKLKGDRKLYYLAVSEAIDDEMMEKIAKHKQSRNQAFETIEEPINVHERLTNLDGVMLFECVSMWINNMIYYGKSDKEILDGIDKITKLPLDTVFVINNVGNSVVSEHALVRRFVNINGVVAQKIASECDEVFQCLAGISLKIK